MARPQVFVSSTFYDLKTVREDIARFLRDLGCEPVRHEAGRIPYAKGQSLENSCYREIELCDILVCIVGGRFGTPSVDGHYSITQKELRTAIDSGKQVFVFVERSVDSENVFFEKNKHLDTLQLSAANDKRVHEFLTEIRQLPLGYPIFPFETATDIVTVLREQFAGLFQRLLSEVQLQQSHSLVSQLQSSLDSVTNLVQNLAKEKTENSLALRFFLETNHPVFELIASAIRVKFRVYFSTRQELDSLLKEVKSLTAVEEVFWDDSSLAEWAKVVSTPDKEYDVQWILKLPADIFDDDGRLKPAQEISVPRTAITYSSAQIKRAIPKKSKLDDFDDDIPF